MIVLRVFLGMIWAVVALVYWILCGLHIEQPKVIRSIALGSLGLCIFLSYFAFPVEAFLVLTVLELLLYVRWERQEAHPGFVEFRPSRFVRANCSWIVVKQEDVLIKLVFPRFLTRLITLVLSIHPKLRPLVGGFGGTEIEVQSKDEYVSIHIYT
jgi:hypothetical protein